MAYITIGKIGATYGIRGWLKIHSYTEQAITIFDYKPWYLLNETDGPRLIEVENSQVHGNGLIAKLVGINTPETARLLTGKTIAIAQAQLPKLKKNEYYWSDLIGLTVINKNGEIYGTVVYLIATGSNDVLVIKGSDNKEHAIPYLFDTIIQNIDLIKKEIHVDWELL
ncbi:MAG: ribosome maturation factor RimM [Gammaproteobacteria bacterium]|nr:ribosome maturation factor RimM [Gammaproteobacteria bacterium]